jgi:hypothetical protein
MTERSEYQIACLVREVAVAEVETANAGKRAHFAVYERPVPRYS